MPQKTSQPRSVSAKCRSSVFSRNSQNSNGSSPDRNSLHVVGKSPIIQIESWGRRSLVPSLEENGCTDPVACQSDVNRLGWGPDARKDPHNQQNYRFPYRHAFLLLISAYLFPIEAHPSIRRKQKCHHSEFILTPSWSPKKSLPRWPFTQFWSPSSQRLVPRDPLGQFLLDLPQMEREETMLASVQTLRDAFTKVLDIPTFIEDGSKCSLSSRRRGVILDWPRSSWAACYRRRERESTCPRLSCSWRVVTWTTTPFLQTRRSMYCWTNEHEVSAGVRCLPSLFIHSLLFLFLLCHFSLYHTVWSHCYLDFISLLPALKVKLSHIPDQIQDRSQFLKIIRYIGHWAYIP